MDMRQIDLGAPHITDRVAGWAEEVGDREQTPELLDPDRELLSNTLSRVSTAINGWGTGEQLLHGEPHPGNLLRTRKGPLFVDLHTCQCGQVEYDIAYAPKKLESSTITTAASSCGLGSRRRDDQLPNRDYWRIEGLNQLRAALDRYGLDWA